MCNAQITVASLLSIDFKKYEELAPLAELSSEVSAPDNKNITQRSSVMVTTPDMSHTAFFCKIEDKVSRRSRFQVKMRLGDVRYTDYVEGKGSDPLLTPR